MFTRTAKIAFFTLLTLVLMPSATFAQGLIEDGSLDDDNEFANLASNVLQFVNDYLIPFVLAIAFLVFVWGVFKYFVLGGSDEDKQSEGKNLIIYSVIGFVIILSLYGIVGLLVNAFGFDPNETIEIPSVPLTDSID